MEAQTAVGHKNLLVLEVSGTKVPGTFDRITPHI